MLLNKKYKCPVCSDECITLRDWLNFNGKNYIICNNCNSNLSYTKSSNYKSWLVFFLISLTAIFFEPKPIKLMVYVLAGMGVIGYLALFGELEENIEEEPVFNLNKFLDNLKISNSKK